jgi:filamentous hemagglutinin family protein
MAGMVLRPGASAAEVVTDGSLGAKARLSGKDVKIPARLGQVGGHNLFHSFQRFGIAAGDKATFTGPDRLKNVIARVTGGERSTIDGTLASTVRGADLWLLNPAGILFGPGARLDVKGSFHASTADELRFADGKVFSALAPGGSVLSVAEPQAFGFLGARPGPISVDGSVLRACFTWVVLSLS